MDEFRVGDKVSVLQGRHFKTFEGIIVDFVIDSAGRKMVKIVEAEIPSQTPDPHCVNWTPRTKLYIVWIFLKFIRPISSVCKVEMLTHIDHNVRRGAELHGTLI